MRRALGSLCTTSLLLAACAQQTKLTETWAAPAGGSAQVHHVLAVFATRDPGIRHALEDRLVRQLPNSAPSYDFVVDPTSIDRDRLRQQMLNKGFDGVMVMRVADIDRQLTYVPGASTWPAEFYCYWGNAWQSSYDPAHYMVNGAYGDFTLVVETALYHVGTNKLLWAGRSRTTDSRSINKAADQVALRAISNMRLEQLLP